MTDTLILRSHDRADGTSHQFRLALSQALEGRWALEYASIPNTAFQITTSNNTLLVTQSGALHSVVVPSGYYSHVGMVAAVQVALRQVDASSQVTYSSLTNRMTITAGTAISFGGGQSMGPVIGITADTASLTAHTGVEVDLVSRSLCFHIVIDTPGCSYPVSDAAGRHATYWVPVSQDSMVHCEYKSGDFRGQQTALFRTPTREIHCRIVDSDHATMDLRGQEWWAVLRRV